MNSGPLVVFVTVWGLFLLCWSTQFTIPQNRGTYRYREEVKLTLIMHLERSEMVHNINGVEYEIPDVPDDEIESLMTLEEIAAALGYSPATLRNWRSRGNHPLMNDKAIRLTARSIRWRAKDVNEWIAGIGYENPATK